MINGDRIAVIGAADPAVEASSAICHEIVGLQDLTAAVCELALQVQRLLQEMQRRGE